MKCAFLGLFVCLAACSSSSKDDTIKPLTFTDAHENILEIQLVNDRVFHFEYLPHFQTRAEPSVMIPRRNWPEPASLRVHNDGFETSALHVTVETRTLCFRVEEGETTTAKICPGTQSLTVAAPQITHVYGLGEEFTRDDGKQTNMSFNWLGRRRAPGSEFGNKMVGFDGGANANAQFPVAYALDAHRADFALVIDNHAPQTWDLQPEAWTIEIPRGPERGYFLAAHELPVLRREFMGLVGLPPVLPKKAFGLWVSEYGYDNWEELEDKLHTLRAHHFPLDGFVLDLQWFGGIKEKSTASRMGDLQWDETYFPHPAAKIQELAAEGVGLVTIEEPFIARGTSAYPTLAKKGYLEKSSAEPGAPPASLDQTSNWWGYGGLFDYIQDDAADFWHDWKRQPLVDEGILGHWTDLGEPEAFAPEGFYDHGKFAHADIHNIYNLKWTMSVARGYERHHVERRLWILSRSGTIGSQRYGVSLWSGDIGGNFASLRAQLRAQAHMSFSGIDNFGSDIGGFHHEATKGKAALDDLYTQWFADSALFDIPVRPHTENLCNCKETAPDRIGERASNLENLRLRYRLLPYYYGLAHLAHEQGSPIVAPLVYYFPKDAPAREIADEKMIGPSLLAAAAASPHIKTRDVYLPPGDWYDFHSGRRLHSTGKIQHAVAVRTGERLRLPLYVRAGTILPEAEVLDDGRLSARRVLHVFPTDGGAQATIYDDDGFSTAYLKGALSKTPVRQSRRGDHLLVNIDGEDGAYRGQPDLREYLIDLVYLRPIQRVSVNSHELERLQTKDRRQGWYQDRAGVHVNLSATPIHQPLVVEFEPKAR